MRWGKQSPHPTRDAPCQQRRGLAGTLGPMPRITLLWLAGLPIWAQNPGNANLETQAAQLRALVEQAPRLALERTEFAIQKPGAGWGLEMVSSVAVDRNGVIYLLQRGDKADPVIAVNREGRVLRSWGKGLYKIPHSIRIDPSGNVWTVDAASSMVLKFGECHIQLSIDKHAKWANIWKGGLAFLYIEPPSVHEDALARRIIIRQLLQ